MAKEADGKRVAADMAEEISADTDGMKVDADMAEAISADADGMKVDADTAEVNSVDAGGKKTDPDMANVISVDVISAKTGDEATAAEDHGGTKTMSLLKKSSIRTQIMTETKLQDQKPACENTCKRAAGRFEVFDKLRQFQNHCKLC